MQQGQGHCVFEAIKIFSRKVIIVKSWFWGLSISLESSLMASSSSDDDTPPGTPAKKRRVRYDQKYAVEWESTYSWVKKSIKGEAFFYCTACNANLKCGGGKKDIERHAASGKHATNSKGIGNQPKIDTVLPSTSTASSKTFKEKVKAGEVKLTSFIAEHNLAFKIAGHLKSVVQSACPDSKIAAEFTLERTKARAIVTNVTGQASENELIEHLKENKFSLVVDESTDRSKTKHLAVFVRTSINFQIVDRFLTLIPIVDGTAISLYNEIVNFFKAKNIPYKNNMIGFAADGANTMFGEHHSLAVLLSNDIPTLFKIKCVCHSFHLCCSYACRKLPRGVEDFARDVYNYIQNSPKRTGDFKEFQDFVNVKPHKLLHPSQTRWLSLLPVVRRLLEQLPALKLYFQSAVLTDRLLAAQSILDKSMEPSTELYLEFLSFVLPFFQDLNKELQSEQPKLYNLYEKIFVTYKTLLECFIRPELLELTVEEETMCTNKEDQEDMLERKILNIDFENFHHHLDPKDLYLGGNIAALITLRRNNYLQQMSDESILLFKQKCLEFYIEALKQVKARFPFHERKHLKSLHFLSPDNLLDPALKRKLPSIAGIAVLFPGLGPPDFTELDREWRILRNTKLPFQIEDNVKVDDFWRHISKIKKGDGTEMFPLVSIFTKNLLCLPHSSANVERLFSAINLMKTNTRNKLNTTSIKGLLHTKSAIKTTCYEVELTDKHMQLFNAKMYSKQIGGNGIGTDTDDSD